MFFDSFQVEEITIANNADKSHGQWLRNGAKESVNFPGFTHDVGCFGDIISSRDAYEKAKLVSKEGRKLLKKDVTAIHAVEGTTYSHIYTYVLHMVALKFGEQAVVMGGDASWGWRGIANRPEVKDYARKVAEVAVDRIVNFA
jgi:hypothetical protein